MAAETVRVRCRVNGAEREIVAPPFERLLDSLRLRLGLTGTKEGCGEGECGACSVLLDGVLVNACLVPVAEVDGCEILTIEGASGDRVLAALQASFADGGGAQCGICTPGMVLAAGALLKREADPDEPAIRDALAGNLCRCTGYVKIVSSVRAAAEALGKGAPR